MKGAKTLRGRTLHNRLVNRAAHDLSEAGFITTRECPMRLPDGRMDYIDVLALREMDAVACEVETTPRSVVTNAEKALSLSLLLMIVVPNRRTGNQIRAVLARNGLPVSGDRIWILLPGQLSQAVRNCFPNCRSANDHSEKEQTNVGQATPVGLEA